MKLNAFESVRSQPNVIYCLFCITGDQRILKIKKSYLKIQPPALYLMLTINEI